MKPLTLYKFDGLKHYLNLKGFPKAGAGVFQILKRNLALGMQQGEITIRKDGIFCMIDGHEHRGYIFNQKPDISQYKVPKFHIAECDVVENRKSLHGDYIWTNTEQVQLYDRGRGGIAYPGPNQLTTLSLCSKCKGLVDKQLIGVITTDEFHKYLIKHYGEVKKPNPVKIDIDGYTIDFKMISQRYRESKKYKYEKCKLDLSEGMNRRYLHVHHRNGHKTDNRLENLECLCIRCHSNVDERHQVNFGKRTNQRELDSFNERFPIERSLKKNQ